VVNRASRIVNIAFPGSVVVSTEICEALADADGVVFKSIGSRNLKDIGKVPLFVARRATAEVRTKSSREVLEGRRAARREARVEELEERRSRSDRRDRRERPDRSDRSAD
jgi:hypothetical protein